MHLISHGIVQPSVLTSEDTGLPLMPNYENHDSKVTNKDGIDTTNKGLKLLYCLLKEENYSKRLT